MPQAPGPEPGVVNAEPRRSTGYYDCGGPNPGMCRRVFTLLSDVKPFGPVGILILASEELPEDGIISGERQGWTIVGRVREITHGFLTPLGLMCHPAR